MKYIKTCPDCGQKIRFPLDKGKIKVKCSCGYNLLVNPDETTLYNEGKFDLSADQKQNSISGLKALSNRLKKKLNKKDVVNYLLDIKYGIQNMRHLPKARRRIFFILFIFLAHVAGFTLFALFFR